MIAPMRVAGFVMISAGIIVVAFWLIEPLRFIWPLLADLPWPLRLGFSLAAIGLLTLMTSLIWERVDEREDDRTLHDTDDQARG